MRRFVYPLVLLALYLLPIAASAAISRVGKGTKITVSTTPVLMKDSSIILEGDRYLSVCVIGTGSSTIFVNAFGVTKDTGTPVDTGKCWYSGERLAKTVKIYAVTASGTAEVRVTEAGN